MSRAEQLRAELAVAELEEQLAEAKQAGTVSDELKQRLRDARRAHRLSRSGSEEV